jgi:hypothetical protein
MGKAPAKGRRAERREGAQARVRLNHRYVAAGYAVMVVASRLHQGYDGLVESLGIGVIAESNGWPTKEEAFEGAARDLSSIVKHVAVPG